MRDDYLIARLREISKTNDWHDALMLSEVAADHIDGLVGQLKKSRETFNENCTQLGKSDDNMVVAVNALESLACLGNGEEHGSSEGNMIARAALKAIYDNGWPR